MPGATDRLWGIILAGGEGQRLRPFIKSHLGSERPKQYCAVLGTRLMLRHTIARFGAWRPLRDETEWVQSSSMVC